MFSWLNIWNASSGVCRHNNMNKAVVPCENEREYKKIARKEMIAQMMPQKESKFYMEQRSLARARGDHVLVEKLDNLYLHSLLDLGPACEIAPDAFTGLSILTHLELQWTDETPGVVARIK